MAHGTDFGVANLYHLPQILNTYVVLIHVEVEMMDAHLHTLLEIFE